MSSNVPFVFYFTLISNILYIICVIKLPIGLLLILMIDITFADISWSNDSVQHNNGCELMCTCIFLRYGNKVTFSLDLNITGRPLECLTRKWNSIMMRMGTLRTHHLTTYTVLTNPIMQLSHIPQYTMQNRNVYISVLNGVLWGMGQSNFGVCEIGLLCVALKYSRIVWLWHYEPTRLWRSVLIANGYSHSWSGILAYYRLAVGILRFRISISLNRCCRSNVSECILMIFGH